MNFTSYDYYDETGGELKSITYNDNSATPPVTFAYNRLGRQETVTDAAGIRTFAYDPDSLRLKSETVEGGSLYGTDDTVITRSYNTAEGVKGRPTGFSLNMNGLPSPDYSVTYGYDGTGRFSSVTWNAGSTSGGAAYTYVPKSDQIYQQTTDYGQTTTYSYKPHRNLRTRVKNEFNGTVISQYDYKYDSLGRRSHMTKTCRSFSSPDPYKNNGYNDRSELTESRRYSGTPATENPSRYRSYLYDSIGNRNQAVRRSDIPETTDYVPNKLNQYDSLTVSGAGTTAFTHDEDGNLTSDSTLKYTYNAENRLIAAEPKNPAAAGVKVEFTYDYMGRRVRKAVYTRNADNTDWNTTTPQSETLFVYDGWNMIAELTKTGGVITPAKYYVWGIDLSGTLQGAGGIGGLLASVDNLTFDVYYYLYDGNGNVGQLVNSDVPSFIAAHYEYDPFGNIIKSEGEYKDSNVYRFSTKFFDVETKLYYYGFRFYASQMGRWLSRDTIGETGGLNLYGFNRNNSIILFDPIGLDFSLQEIWSEFFDALNSYKLNKYGYIEFKDKKTGKKITLIAKCNVIMFYGHGIRNVAKYKKLTTEEKNDASDVPATVINQNCSAAEVFGCNVGHYVSVKKQTPGAINPKTTVSGNMKKDMEGLWNRGIKHAKYICKDQSCCCEKVTVRFDYRIEWLRKVPGWNNKTEIVPCS